MATTTPTPTFNDAYRAVADGLAHMCKRHDSLADVASRHIHDSLTATIERGALQSALDEAVSHLADVVRERDAATLERDAARERRDFWCRHAARLSYELAAVTKGRDILAAVLLSGGAQ